MCYSFDLIDDEINRLEMCTALNIDDFFGLFTLKVMGKNTKMLHKVQGKGLNINISLHRNRQVNRTNDINHMSQS